MSERQTVDQLREFIVVCDRLAREKFYMSVSGQSDASREWERLRDEARADLAAGRVMR